MKYIEIPKVYWMLFKVYTTQTSELNISFKIGKPHIQIIYNVALVIQNQARNYNIFLKWVLVL